MSILDRIRRRWGSRSVAVCRPHKEPTEFVYRQLESRHLLDASFAFADGLLALTEFSGGTLTIAEFDTPDGEHALQFHLTDDAWSSDQPAPNEITVRDGDLFVSTSSPLSTIRIDAKSADSPLDIEIESLDLGTTNLSIRTDGTVTQTDIGSITATGRITVHADSAAME